MRLPSARPARKRARAWCYGVRGLDHSATSTGPKLRFVLTARLTVDAPLKSVPDHHGRGAQWVTLEDLDKLPLRDGEVRTWIQKAESGRALLPIEAYAFFS